MEITRAESAQLQNIVEARLRDSEKAKAEKPKSEKKSAGLHTGVAKYVPLVNSEPDVRTDKVAEARKFLEFPDWDCIEAARKAAHRLVAEAMGSEGQE